MALTCCVAWLYTNIVEVALSLDVLHGKTAQAQLTCVRRRVCTTWRAAACCMRTCCLCSCSGVVQTIPKVARETFQVYLRWSTTVFFHSSTQSNLSCVILLSVDSEMVTDIRDSIAPLRNRTPLLGYSDERMLFGKVGMNNFRASKGYISQKRSTG